LDISNWSFSNGITYTFPAGTTLSPYEAVTLVHFAPTTDPTDLAAFDSAYVVPATARLLGPFTDKLSSKGEEVTLVRPDTPRADDPGYTPLILVDDFTFGITAPWPVTTAGQAVTRLSNHTFAEDPTNWSAQSPSIDYVPYGNAWFGGTTNYAYSAPTTLDSLTLAGTATVTVSTGAGTALTAGGLTLPTGTKLDAGSSALDLSNVTLAAVDGLVTTGYANGAWTGLGLTSSAAAANPSHLTALGVIQNNQAGTPIFSSTNLFEGTIPGASDILVKYTYYGDANLDGRVDGSDYTKIDAGFNSHGALTGWLNGDFNYDGKIDGRDYTLIDNAFNTQGASIAAQIASAASKPGTPVFSAQPVTPASVFTDTTDKRRRAIFDIGLSDAS
jgi:hypothetical protein